MGLAEKIRKAREQDVSAGGFTFTVRRPTDLEMMRLSERIAEQDMTALLPFVVGWRGVKEIDLIPGGGAVEVAFDAEACREWLMDRPDIVAPLVEAIFAAYRAHRQALEDAEKN